MTEYEQVKERAYQAWLKEDVFGNRFTVVGQGPLIRDHITDGTQEPARFYDAVEFLMRKFEEERKHTNTRDKP